MSVFEQLKTNEADRTRQAVTEFQQLVKAIGDGPEPSIDEIRTALAATGRTIDELETAVSRYRRRKSLHERLGSIQEAEAAIVKLEQEALAKVEQFATIEKAHRDAVGTLHGRIDELRQTIAQAEAARQELIDSATDPNLLAELRATFEQLQLSQALHNTKGAEVQELQFQKKQRPANETPGIDREIERVRLEMRSIKEETERLAEKRETLRQRADEITARLMNPLAV